MGAWLRQARWALFGLLALMVPASAQTKNSAAQENAAQAPPPDRLPPDETPCFPIERIWLDGEDAHRFFWSLKAADPGNDFATGRCLGTNGINMVMARVQNAVVVRGFVTTRILAAPQDLTLASNLCNNAPSGNLDWNVHWLIRGALRVQVFRSAPSDSAIRIRRRHCMSRSATVLNPNGVYAQWCLPADARAKRAAEKRRLNFGSNSVHQSGMNVRQRSK